MIETKRCKNNLTFFFLLIEKIIKKRGKVSCCGFTVDLCGFFLLNARRG
jgi:hypothetical protein